MLWPNMNWPCIYLFILSFRKHSVITIIWHEMYSLKLNVRRCQQVSLLYVVEKLGRVKDQWINSSIRASVIEAKVRRKKLFLYAGPKAWNELPLSLHELTDNFLFKKQLKTHLFTLAYNT